MGRPGETAPKGFMLPREAAQVLECSEETVKNRIRSRRLKGRHFTNDRGENRYYAEAEAGIVSAVLALFVGGLGGAFEAEGSGTIVGLGWSALFFSLLGLVGAALSLAKPRIAAVVMLVAAIAVGISISLFAVIASPLFLVAALLTFLGRHTSREEITVQTTTRH